MLSKYLFSLVSRSVANVKWRAIFLLLIVSQSTKALTEVELVLNWKPEPQFGGFYQASLSELDKKFGFTFKISPGGSGTPTLQILLAKKAPLVILSADEIILAHARGQTQVKAIFAVFQNNPQMIMAKKSSQIKSFPELIQRSDYTLQWQAGLPYAQFLQKKFKDQFKIKQAPYLGGITQFLNQEKIVQQGFETSEALIVPKDLEVEIFRIRDLGFNPYTTVVAVHEDWLTSNLLLAKSIVKVLQKAWDEYLANPASVNQFMARINPFTSQEFFDLAAKAQYGLIKPSQEVPIGKMQVQRWSELLNQLREAQVISSDDKKIKLKPTDFYVDLM